MKPQDAKNTNPRPSTTQEGARASLESPSATMEQLRSATEKTLPFSHEELQDIIAGLERDIADSSWLKGNYHYADMDLRMMPILLERANNKYQGLNLKLVTTSEDLCHSIKEAMDNGIYASRYIVTTTDRGIHTIVLDQRTIDGKTSLIAFEPATLRDEIPLLLAVRLQLTLQRHLSDCHFSMVEMDIQRSSSECAIFSLGLAKKLHREADQLTKMHED
ncbi:YopJ family acetyltransferase, partial [Bartonella acomydis]|uniref:YopJ family acetyltransferase n=1 Tax=Bartonella acomydis TaxID=686234 RepID=UPI0031F08489